MFKPETKPDSNFDYRLLLIKYINHVGMMEGVSFIDDKIEGMTEIEIEELVVCEKESGHYYEYLREKRSNNV
ncbi:hypothetical protein [Flavobacterium sp.]|jgi:hypothetical protein|uniref:hypothetical protein n=1 Tax=Flavobacterium sp. TaxID=239 RepID=UPI0037BF1320